MSLVGPRPLYMQQIAEWDQRQRSRLNVKPGLTGYAQIRGRGSLTVEEKLEYDVQYVQRVGLKTDVLIVLETVRKLIKREGIYEQRYSAKLERRSGR
jgi:lipopolysaccharide/colanic/teichoic acid biosynthesis glycosyltransferase